MAFQSISMPKGQGLACTRKWQQMLSNIATGVHIDEETVEEEELHSPVYQAQHAEQAKESEDALTQLADQIPQPYPVHSNAAETSLQHPPCLTHTGFQSRYGSPGREGCDCRKRFGIWEDVAGGSPRS